MNPLPLPQAVPAEKVTVRLYWVRVGTNERRANLPYIKVHFPEIVNGYIIQKETGTLPVPKNLFAEFQCPEQFFDCSGFILNAGQRDIAVPGYREFFVESP